MTCYQQEDRGSVRAGAYLIYEVQSIRTKCDAWNWAIGLPGNATRNADGRVFVCSPSIHALSLWFYRL